MSNIKLSIIIVNWNTKELLMQCVKSLMSNVKTQMSNVEIIVVDNGSTDGSVEMLKKYVEKNSREFVSGTEKLSKREELRVPLIRDNSCNQTIKLIENRINLGFAKGNNIGIKQARGEYIMLLNTDTIIKEGAIEKLVNSLDESSDEVAAISPLVLNSDESVQKDPCYLKFPSPLFVLFYYNPVLKKIALRLFPKLLFSATDFSKPVFIDQLPGAAIIIRKKVLDKIGLFDETFQIYFEDSDLCIRTRKAGYKLLLEPAAGIIHLGRQSIKPLIDKEGVEKFYLLNFESLFRFCKKHYSLTESRIIIITVFLNLLFSRKIGLIKKILFSHSS